MGSWQKACLPKKMENLMKWLEDGPSPTDINMIRVSAGQDDNNITGNEYDKVTKEIIPVRTSVITEEDVEDMKQRLATFEYLLRHLTIQYNEQSDYLKKLLDRSDKPKKRVRRKRKVDQEEASKIVENSFRRQHIEPPKRTTSRVKIERIQLPKVNRAERQSSFNQVLLHDFMPCPNRMCFNT